MYTRRLLFTLFILLQTVASFAQQKPKLEYSGFFDSYYFRGPLAFSAGIGVAAYRGDLCTTLDCITPKLAYNFGINYRVWPRTVFGAEYTYFQLQATDRLPNRNLSFTSTNHEFDLYSRLYLIEDIVRVAADRNRKPKKFKIYIHLGVGFVNYNPTSYGLVFDTAYVKTEPKTFPKTTIVIPFGLGFSFSFSHRVQLLAELNYRYAFSDYLDGVGKARGNSQFKDNYGIASLKVQYAPWAPKVKRKKKYKGQNPGGGGGEGGGEGAPAEGGTETPAPSQNAQPNNGAEQPASPEQPSNEQPPQEGTPQEGTPQENQSEQTPQN